MLVMIMGAQYNRISSNISIMIMHSNSSSSRA